MNRHQSTVVHGDVAIDTRELTTIGDSFSSLSKKEGAVDTDELHQKKVTAGNPFFFESNVRELRQDCLSRTKQKGS